MKTVFTTGQVARICGVTVVTVNKWFDSGKLKGHKMPGSRSRRIPYTCLVEFMQDNGIPMERLDELVAKRILIVDDDKSSRTKMVKAVKDYFKDAEVVELEDGVTACLELGKKAPKLVVLDLTLPGVDSLEICRRIRSDPNLSNTRILVVTGRVPKATVEKAKEAGANECMAKPINTDKFIRMVSHLSQLPISV